MAVKPIPDGFHSVTPFVIVPGVAELIDFLKNVFDAKEIERMARPDGVVMHAEVKIGDSIIMMGEPTGQWAPMAACLYVYVKDADATYKRALAAGATSLTEPADQFYGDRNAGVKDPSGNFWWIATHIEDVAPAEIEKRAQAAMSKGHGA